MRALQKEKLKRFIVSIISHFNKLQNFRLLWHCNSHFPTFSATLATHKPNGNVVTAQVPTGAPRVLIMELHCKQPMVSLLRNVTDNGYSFHCNLLRLRINVQLVIKGPLEKRGKTIAIF